MYGKDTMQNVVNDHGSGTLGPGIRRACPSSPLPSTKMLYAVQFWKSVVCVRVSVWLLFDHVRVSAMFGVGFTTTVGGAIGSLNCTTIGLASGTRVSESFGSVDVMYGDTQIVEKLHGFGARPFTSGKPATLLPAVICTVYCVHSVNGVWLMSISIWNRHVMFRIRTLFGAIWNWTVAASIASLKAMRMTVFSETFVSPSPGLVAIIYGLEQTVSNLKGFFAAEGGPAKSGFPNVSVPDAVTVYGVHPVNADVWVMTSVLSLFCHVKVLPATSGTIVKLVFDRLIDLLKFT